MHRPSVHDTPLADPATAVAITACPVCGSRQIDSVALIDGKTGDALHTVNCLGCGLGRIDPLPTRQELAQWYTHHYRQNYKGAVQPALRHVLRAGRNALDRWDWLQLQRIRHGLNLPASSITMDIGASGGEFVYLMKQRGYRARGIEPHAGYAAHARDALGLEVQGATLHDALPQLPPGEVGLFSMFHVLEHLVDPIDTLQEIRRKTSRDGLLFIEVPNATRFCSPRYMFFRAHTLYFTQASLHQTLRIADWNIVAHNHAQEGNLRVLASPSKPPTSATLQYRADTALVQAQHRRRWPSYIARQLTSGQFVRKLATRIEEHRTAARFSEGRSLLDHLYQVGSTP